MVPRTDLANAVSLNSASFNAARIVGPGVAGLLIAARRHRLGRSSLNTLSFVAVLRRPDPMRRASCARPADRSRARGRSATACATSARRPDIILILALVFCAGTFGMNFQITTALMATEEFHKGAGEYGLLGSIMAIGSLAGALMAARRARPRLRILLVAARRLRGVQRSLAGAGARRYLLFALLLVPVGLTRADRARPRRTRWCS